MKRKQWYIGLANGGRIRKTFTSDVTPTQATHGAEYAAVVGPFRTKRGAMFHAAVGAANPHVRNVADAERIARQA